MNRFLQVIIKNLPWIAAYTPRMVGMSKNPDRYSEEQRYAMAMKVVDRVAVAGNITVVAYGKENIPKEGGYLICPNHQDKFDPLAIWKTHEKTASVVIDDAACHRPIICDFVNYIKAVKLEKNSLKAMLKMTEEVTQRLLMGERFILFPEGQYEEDYHVLGPFMSGCFRSSIRSKTPILPVAIIDSFRAFAKSEPGEIVVSVHYLEPIMPEEIEGLKTNEVAAIVRDRIQTALDQHQK